jgi:sortase A
MKRTLKCTQWLLFTLGFALLSYCVVMLVDARVFQLAESRQFERLLAVRVSPVSLSAPLPPPVDGLIGRMEIPRLGLSVIVVEGTSWKALRHAAGHVAGTALPGQPGNVGVSAHRDTFFRPLRNIRADDLITLTTLTGEYRYRVVSTRIVSPAHVAVLNPDGGEILTLVTCYPFYFVGSAPDRFIVRAERVK